MQDRHLYRFGNYVLDAERMVLRRGDGVVALPPKALLTLLVLVEEAGEVVSKQQLMERVWGETFVEEGNLSQNIFLLRRELGKSEAGENYIQTLSKRGYRLNVPVERVPKTVPPAISPAAEKRLESTDAQAEQPTFTQPSKSRASIWTVLLFLVVSLGLASLWREKTAVPHVSDFTQLTHDGAVKRGHMQTSAGPDAALLTDGARIYFTEGTSDSLTLAEVSVSGGETSQIPTAIAGPQLLDISRARSELLVSGRSNSAAAGALWVIPTPAGSAHEIGGVHASDASWSPDGKRIAFTSGRDLFVANADGSEPKQLATLPGSAWRPRWSPDGQRIRLTVYTTRPSGDSLWEVGSEGRGLRQILQDLAVNGEPVSVCCGSWTPDGRSFVFTGLRGGKSEIWSVPDRPRWLKWLSSSRPTQLTGGQLNSLSPLVSPDGRQLFVIGQQLRGELQRFDPVTRQFVSYLGGKSMDFLSFSREGDWITWVEYPERTLWRSRADGSDKLQLTFAPLHAMAPRWSPDAKSIVFYAGSGGGQRAFIISADGGQPTPLGWTNEMLPNWSPDGETILHSEFPFFVADPRKISLHLVHLKTHQTEVVPGSDGLFAGQWSPDGRYIAALPFQGSTIKLFDVETRTWTELGKGAGFLVWSHDSKFLYCLRAGPDPAVVKYRLRDRQMEEVASLSGIRESGQLAGLEFGLNPDEQPYILRDIGTQEIYSLMWHDR